MLRASSSTPPRCSRTSWAGCQAKTGTAQWFTTIPKSKFGPCDGSRSTPSTTYSTTSATFSVKSVDLLTTPTLKRVPGLFRGV